MDFKLGTPDLQLSKMKAADQNQHIQVFVRVRPINQQERMKNSSPVLDCPGTKEVVVKERAVTCTKTFTFDRVFGPCSKQIEVYKTVVAPLLEEVLLGYNCTVFAYGQTGTGKTFTMEGERTPDPDLSWEQDPLSGIVPRALSQLFDELRLSNAEFTVRVSLLELYNEELFDLLSPPTEDSKIKTLRIFEDSNRKGSVIIQGLEEVTVHNKHEVYRIMEQGNERRRTASTQMNVKSSRSHTVFTVTVHIKESTLDGEELVKVGKLHLVDLAGSENIGRSGAVDKRAREAGSINQSLLTLGRVITALVERTPHIPYRESKLTRLLQDSLGGRTKTSIIATVSPASVNVEETLSTLDYAHRAKDITNKPEINQRMTKRAVMRNYTEEIERLRRDLNACREKNGVYVEKDNFAHMLAQIESQSQEISDKIVHARDLEEKLQKKEEELNLSEARLEETEDELRTCNDLLAISARNLEETRSQLQAIRADRDQKSFLVQEHLRTEKTLTKQAKVLLTTTDDATDSLEKMYKKLDRKKVVEIKNMEAGRRFNVEVSNGLGSVCGAIEDFRVNHSEFCGKLRLSLESYLQTKEKELFIEMQEIFSLVGNIQNFGTKEYVNVQILQFLSDNKENMGEMSRRTEEGQIMVTSLESKVCEDVKTVCLHVQGLWRTMEGAIKNYVEKTRHQFTKMEDFVQCRLNFLEKLTADCESSYKKQSLTLSGVKATVEAQEELLTVNKKANIANLEVMREMMERISRQNLTFDKEMESTTTKLQEDIRESSETSKCLMELIQMKKGEEIRATDELMETLVKDQRNSENQINHVQIQAKEIADKTVSHLSTLRQYMEQDAKAQTAEWKNLTSWDKKRSTEQNDQLKTFSFKVNEFENGMEELVKKSMERFRCTLREGGMVDKAFVSGNRAELETHCRNVSDWADGIREKTFEQAGKVGEFWEHTYLVDGPTGATPQRKAYQYPRHLTATSPHDRLIGRYLKELQQNKENNPEETGPEPSQEIF